MFLSPRREVRDWLTDQRSSQNTHLLFASRKRGSTRAETEYRVVISGGKYCISNSPPSCTGAASTSVSTGMLKERSLWSIYVKKTKTKKTKTGQAGCRHLRVWILTKNFFKLGQGSAHSWFFQSTSTILSTPLVSSLTRTRLCCCCMAWRNLDNCWIKRWTNAYCESFFFSCVKCHILDV